MTPRPISVIVCTRNRADRLSTVISLLRDQDYPADAFEIIVVDNQSNDGTPQAVANFVGRPGVSVQYVAENRPGITYARNRGAEAAHFSYLAYLDDDCSVEPDWLSQLGSGFDLDDRVDAVAGRILVDFDDQPRPAWLEPRSDRWLGAYSFPGSEPRLLEYPLYVCEGNMALSRSAWEAAGGFLGMDQFGSPHVAAQELGIFLKQLERQGRRVAFVPRALAHHRPGKPTWRWMLRRAYLHGVSVTTMDYLLYRRTWAVVGYYVIVDAAATIVFIGFAVASLLRTDVAAATYHFLRAARRVGKILSALRLAGDWPRVQSWMSTHADRLRRVGLPA